MSSLLTYLNSATDMFGGAIDIILIKQPDGSLRSTPFHVRFGRLKLLRSREKIIRIMINGKLTDMVMRISEQDGVAYFVQQQHEETSRRRIRHGGEKHFPDADSADSFLSSPYSLRHNTDYDSFTTSATNSASDVMSGTTDDVSSLSVGALSESDDLAQLECEDSASSSQQSKLKSPHTKNWLEMDFASSEEDEDASSSQSDHTTLSDKVNEERLRREADMAEEEMNAKEGFRDENTGLNTNDDMGSTEDEREELQHDFDEQLKQEQVEGNHPPASETAPSSHLPSPDQASTAHPAEDESPTKPARWRWMQKIFGMNQNNNEEDSTTVPNKDVPIEKNAFVEQTLMETLKKKYHYEIDEQWDESSGEDDSLVFEIEHDDDDLPRSSRRRQRKRTSQRHHDSSTSPSHHTRKSSSNSLKYSTTPAAARHSSSSNSLSMGIPATVTSTISSSVSTSSPRDIRSNFLHDPGYSSADSDDPHNSDMASSLTPSLPPQMRESIRALNNRPQSNSLPRNFVTKNDVNGVDSSKRSPSPSLNSSLLSPSGPDQDAFSTHSQISPRAARHVSFTDNNLSSSSLPSLERMDSLGSATAPSPGSPVPSSDAAIHHSQSASDAAGGAEQPTTPVPSTEQDNNSSWWWFSKKTPQQQKGPPKLRTIRASKPLQKQLQALDLKRGKNTIKYIVTGRVLGTQEIEASIYLWNYDDKIVISDVDGTITKSDGLGHVLPMLGMDWSHSGIAELYTSIMKNGYKIIYLTSRSIVQSATTKVYISSLRQGKLKLPEGPVILSSDRLFACLTREVILRRPEEFKIATLQEIKSLFDPKDNPQPFFAGFGNRKTDIVSYKTVGVPDHKIFTIDPTGNIKVFDNLNHKSYTDVHQLVNLMFPDVKSKFLTTDLSYWNLGIPSVNSIENLSALKR